MNRIFTTAYNSSVQYDLRILPIGSWDTTANYSIVNIVLIINAITKATTKVKSNSTISNKP